jgi:hypothetical protein
MQPLNLKNNMIITTKYGEFLLMPHSRGIKAEKCRCRHIVRLCYFLKGEFMPEDDQESVNYIQALIEEKYRNHLTY